MLLQSLFLLLSVVMGSLSFSFTKQLSIFVTSSLILSTYRLVVSGFFYSIMGMPRIKINEIFPKKLSVLLYDAVLGGSMILTSMLFVQYALVVAPVAACGSIFSMSPAISGIIAWYVLKDKLSVKQIILSIVVMLAAFVPFVTGSIVDGGAIKIAHIWENLVMFKGPMILMFLGVVLNNSFWIYIKWAMNKQDREMHLILTTVYVSGGILGILVCMLWYGAPLFIKDSIPLFTTPKLFGQLIASTFLYNVVAQSLYAAALKKHTVTFAAIVSSFALITDSLIAYMLLGEAINPFIIVTFIIVTIATHEYNSDSDTPQAVPTIK